VWCSSRCSTGCGASAVFNGRDCSSGRSVAELIGEAARLKVVACHAHNAACRKASLRSRLDTLGDDSMPGLGPW